MRAMEQAAEDPLDLIALGRRVRHLRKKQGKTLDDLAAELGTAPSQLSLLENGKREPKLSQLQQLGSIFGVSLDDLFGAEPPSKRAALEIELEKTQRGPLYAALGLPTVRISNRLPMDVLESLVALQRELKRRLEEQAATPEEARRANTELREEMKSRNNYYPEIESEAAALLEAVGYTGGPLGHHIAAQVAEHLGFAIRFVPNLPNSTRSVTDQRNRIIYLTQGRSRDWDARSVLLQALGHHVLGHQEPADYSEFLKQRVDTNYFAAALLMPEQAAVDFLSRAKGAKELAIEDLRDAFAVSYESAAHRFTNLATEHLGITCHFQKVHETGIIHKAYENDGVSFPADHSGAIEGQTVCRRWTSREVFDVEDKFRSFNQYTDTPAGTYWCTARTEGHSSGMYSLSIGVPFEHAKWFRGKDTTSRSVSRCPDDLTCCRTPPEELAQTWEGHAWPAARANTHLLAAMPDGAFPGVDTTEVYRFLQQHSE
ncbi:helix-turn-helix domain-containing protein [Nesterenkonia sp. MY13]|uniref:Helix-turn-helix domain-containing protein n=1 Tax=Nesterenkonia sedimenti TaxID=1463632 RepID=A0A7X8TIY9_9MICC|nr:helix-turn-helix transcriptional regulator [Nesterenkonia sedimenti]NLS09627.1 helix-turn-helix domain-containing protein [Nesterenkonia sedimenti]